MRKQLVCWGLAAWLSLASLSPAFAAAQTETSGAANPDACQEDSQDAALQICVPDSTRSIEVLSPDDNGDIPPPTDSSLPDFHEIGKSAFEHCENLSSVYIPSGVVTIPPDYALSPDVPLSPPSPGAPPSPDVPPPPPSPGAPPSPDVPPPPPSPGAPPSPDVPPPPPSPGAPPFSDVSPTLAPPDAWPHAEVSTLPSDGTSPSSATTLPSNETLPQSPLPLYGSGLREVCSPAMGYAGSSGGRMWAESIAGSVISVTIHDTPDGHFEVEIDSTVFVFTDVFVTAYFFNSVLWAVGNGITNGTSPTEFSPSRDCTHWHILTFLWRICGSPKFRVTESPFGDVGLEGDRIHIALWAAQYGLRDADKNGNFNGNAPCSRAEAMRYIWILSGRPAPNERATFTDLSSVSEESAAAISWAVEKGITNGTSETTFSPDKICSRAHIVTFLYKSCNATQTAI